MGCWPLPHRALQAGLPTCHSLLISPEAAKDIRWWLSALQAHSGVRLWPLATGSTELSLWRPGSTATPEVDDCEADASLLGWGFRWNQERRAGTWTPAQANQTMNWKELKALVIACTWFGPYWQGQRVRIRSDSDTAVAYANRGYGSLPHLSDLARRL